MERGRRVSTYKLAVLIALLDTAVELVPHDPEAAVPVDLDLLTDRIVELYWRQMRPLDGTLLKQSNEGRGVISQRLPTFVKRWPQHGCRRWRR